MQEMMGRHPPPSKAIKTLKQSLQQLVPKVAGMDSGLDLAVEVAPIDYNHTYKYDMVEDGWDEEWLWLGGWVDLYVVVQALRSEALPPS